MLVILELWGMRSTPSLRLLPGPLWPRVVAPDRALSMCLIELSCVLMLNWIVWNETVFWHWNYVLMLNWIETQAWLQKECYNFVPFSLWPSSSSDLNLLDYFVWSYVENITNVTSHNTKTSLIATIRRVFTELPPALVEKARSQFRIRIEVIGITNKW